MAQGTIVAEGAKIDVAQTGNTYTVSHEEVATPTATAGEGRTYLTGVTTDGYGHITGYTTATEEDQDLNNYKTKQTALVAAENDGTKTVKISQNENGEIAVEQIDIAFPEDKNETFAISYNKEEGKIYLTGSDGTNSEIPTADFIKDGMINTVTIGEDNDLIITFNTDAGKENIVLPLDQLVDIYTGSEGDNVKVTVTSDKKIEADLTDAVKDSLAKADSAVQSVALASGTNNGTLKLTVDDTTTDNIAVTGLGSAAYTNSDAYDAAGTAQDLVDALGTMAKENKDNYYTNNEVNTAITTELGKHAGIDKVGTVTSVGVGEGFKNTGTATDPVVDIIQKGEEGAVTWILDCGGATE